MSTYNGRRAVPEGVADPQEPERQGVLRRLVRQCAAAGACLVDQQKVTAAGRMLLMLDCSQKAADELAAMGPSGGPTVGSNGITTVTPTPVVPIGGAPGAGTPPMPAG